MQSIFAVRVARRDRSVLRKELARAVVPIKLTDAWAG